MVTLIEQLESEANAQSRYREESGQPPSFFQNLFQAMKDGTSMLMAWVQLAPQIPNQEHSECPVSYMHVGAGHVALNGHA